MKKTGILGLILLGAATAVSAQSNKAEIPYGMDPLSAYSIFYENYKNENYNLALDYGRWMLYKRPKTMKGYDNFSLERQFERMITIYTEIAKKKEDPTLRTAYLDSALQVYDMVFDTFGSDDIDTFDWTFRKGRYYQQHSDYLTDATSKAVALYQKLYDTDTERFTKLGEGYYAQVMLQEMVANNKKDEALAMIKKMEPYASEKLNNYFDQIRNQLFSSPDERIAYLKDKLKSEPDNVKVMSDLLDLYKRQGQFSEARKMAEQLYKKQPNYDNTVTVADNASENGDYQTAIKYYKEALQKASTAQQKKETSLQLSDAYLNIDQLQSARQYARQALQVDSKFGEAYLQMADIYAAAVNKCTSGRQMDRQDKVVYWLVLDYLDRAKQVNPNLSNTVSQQYKSYKPVTPTAEEKFFSNWETGDKMKVGSNLHKCYNWINETTTVR